MKLTCKRSHLGPKTAAVFSAQLCLPLFVSVSSGSEQHPVGVDTSPQPVLQGVRHFDTYLVQAAAQNGAESLANTPPSYDNVHR